MNASLSNILMVDSSSNYSKLSQENPNQDNYQSPQINLSASEASSHLLPTPHIKHTGNLIVILRRHGKPFLSVGPGCNYKTDTVPLVWFLLEALILIWNVIVNPEMRYNREKRSLNNIGYALIVLMIAFHLSLVFRNPGYLRNVKSDKIDQAMQDYR